MGNDLPDFQSEVKSATVKATSLRSGLDADKPVSPAAGDIWLARDTDKLYICVVAGAWIDLIAVGIAIHAALTATHGVAGTIAGLADIATHAALTTGVHSFDKACRATHNANQSINTSTDTWIAFNTEVFDTDTIHDTVTNNGRLTCKTAGTYLIVAQVSFAFHATGRRAAIITYNAARTLRAILQVPAVSTDNERTDMVVSCILQLAVNDYVEVMVAQTSGGALLVLSLDWSPVFSMVRIG